MDDCRHGCGLGGVRKWKLTKHWCLKFVLKGIARIWFAGSLLPFICRHFFVFAGPFVKIPLYYYEDFLTCYVDSMLLF